MTRFVIAVAAVAALLGAFAGCGRGLPTEKRPAQVIPDMETQKKFKAQGKTEFFADGRMMRVPPAGTVPRGALREDTAYYTGWASLTDSVLVAVNPRGMSMGLLERGRERFNIYCAPCHDQAGMGRGIVATRGKLVPPPTFHDDRLRGIADGHFFEVISNGVRTMPAYKSQISADDRWAIVAYIRALQRSQNATIDDVPFDRRGELR